jgi:hypothetical protein
MRSYSELRKGVRISKEIMNRDNENSSDTAMLCNYHSRVGAIMSTAQCQLLNSHEASQQPF